MPEHPAVLHVTTHELKIRVTDPRQPRAEQCLTGARDRLRSVINDKIGAIEGQGNHPERLERLSGRWNRYGMSQARGRAIEAVFATLRRATSPGCGTPLRCNVTSWRRGSILRREPGTLP